MNIPPYLVKNYLKSVGKDELRRILYEITPHIDTDVVDIFGEVAEWDKQQRPRNVAARVLRNLGR